MLLNYIKLALKVLLRRKFFTFVSLFGIALTLTVLVVAASVLDHTLGTQPPALKQDRMLALYNIRLRGPHHSWGGQAGWLVLDRYVRDLPLVEETSFFTSNETVTSFVEGSKVESHLKRTDGAFWRVFDFDFVEGGPFSDEDHARGRFVAVINDTTRRRFFGKAPAVGRELTCGNQSFRVVGVVRDVAMVQELPYAEIWAPITTRPSTEYLHRFLDNFRAVVLARSRADLPEIQAEFQARIAEPQLPNPERYDTLEAALNTKLEEYARGLAGVDATSGPPGLLRLAIVVGMLLFMALPALNLINLNLSRILERASEIGVRKSFGASSLTLVGQFVVENVVLTLIGAVFGFGLAHLALRAINGSGLIPYAEFDLNGHVFVYGVILALVFGVLSGVYPAWRMSRLHPGQALQGRSQ